VTRSLRHITLLGVPMEEGSGRRGAAMGPAALRIAGIIETLQDLGHTITDQGDIAPAPTDDLALVENANNYQAVAGFTRALEAATYALAKSGSCPVILGGDHALSMGSVSGMARYAQDMNRPLFLLWLDAHADFNSPKTSPSGNIHGMPVAYVCGKADLGNILPKDRPIIDAKRVFQVGIRSVDTRERDEIAAHGVTVFDMRSIDENGIAYIMKTILETVALENGLLHVSFDVDFLDPDLAPGVGTTVPGGATYREAHLIMEMLCDSGLVSSLDLVELNPYLDDRGKSARILVEMTASLFGRRIIDRVTRSA
jgi:arginase